MRSVRFDIGSPRVELVLDREPRASLMYYVSDRKRPLTKTCSRASRRERRTCQMIRSLRHRLPRTAWSAERASGPSGFLCCGEPGSQHVSIFNICFNVSRYVAAAFCVIVGYRNFTCFRFGWCSLEICDADERRRRGTQATTRMTTIVAKANQTKGAAKTCGIRIIQCNVSACDVLQCNIVERNVT